MSSTKFRCSMGSRHRRRRKASLFRRDGDKCWLCGKTMPPEKATLDHVVRLREGGGHALDNLRLACRPCNGARS